MGVQNFLFDLGMALLIIMIITFIVLNIKNRTKEIALASNKIK